MEETIGAFEAKTHLSALLERVAHGESFTISRHGKPVALLVPIEPDDLASRRAAVGRLKAFAKEHNLTLGGIDWRELRDEGRR
jgi:prevent-host-death family protein